VVALTVRDASKWRISSQAKLFGSIPPESHQNFAVQTEDKGEADFRRARSDGGLLRVVPAAKHVCSLLGPLARPIVLSLGDAARRRWA
jgi:hypothetical protein